MRRTSSGVQGWPGISKVPGPFWWSRRPLCASFGRPLSGPRNDPRGSIWGGCFSDGKLVVLRQLHSMKPILPLLFGRKFKVDFFCSKKWDAKGGVTSAVLSLRPMTNSTKRLANHTVRLWLNTCEFSTCLGGMNPYFIVI